MKTGTKSLLFGVHQFLWHPITVFLGWLGLYGWPSWRELICIFIHDWGYWGSPNMDSEEGNNHPYRSAEMLWSKEKNIEMYQLILFHSRHFAKTLGGEPSKLCWADKASLFYDPWWLYLPRAWLSGELEEYRKEAAKAGVVGLGASNREWHRIIRDRSEKLVRSQKGDAVNYSH